MFRPSSFPRMAFLVYSLLRLKPSETLYFICKRVKQERTGGLWAISTIYIDFEIKKHKKAHISQQKMSLLLISEMI